MRVSGGATVWESSNSALGTLSHAQQLHGFAYPVKWRDTYNPGWPGLPLGKKAADVTRQTTFRQTRLGLSSKLHSSTELAMTCWLNSSQKT